MAEKKLTYKQAAFCREYIANKGNATEAYIKAYNWNGTRESAGNEACLLLKNEEVQKEIRTMMNPVLDKTKSTTEERIKVLNDIIDDPLEKTENKIRAIDILNRMYACYVNRTENTNTDTVKLDLSAIDKLLE